MFEGFTFILGHAATFLVQLAEIVARGSFAQLRCLAVVLRRARQINLAADAFGMHPAEQRPGADPPIAGGALQAGKGAGGIGWGGFEAYTPQPLDRADVAGIGRFLEQGKGAFRIALFDALCMAKLCAAKALVECRSKAHAGALDMALLVDAVQGQRAKRVFGSADAAPGHAFEPGARSAKVLLELRAIGVEQVIVTTRERTFGGTGPSQSKFRELLAGHHVIRINAESVSQVDGVAADDLQFRDGIELRRHARLGFRFRGARLYRLGFGFFLHGPRVGFPRLRPGIVDRHRDQSECQRQARDNAVILL